MSVPTVVAKHFRALSSCKISKCASFFNKVIRSSYAESATSKTHETANSMPALETDVKEEETAAAEKRNGERFRIYHDKSKKMFFIDITPEEKAVLQYMNDGQGKVTLYNTEVPEAFQNQGVGGRLAQVVLDHFAANQTYMNLECSYLQKYVSEYPQPHHVPWIIKE